MSKDLAVIVAGAPMQWTERMAATASAASKLFAADGGANHLARIGLRPQAVVGDLDSISPATRVWVGKSALVHRPDQDRTDLEKTLEYVLGEIRTAKVVVFGALGGRPDHELGNLGLLARLGLGERLVFLGDGHRVLAVVGTANIEAVPGETWSFWTYDPQVRATIRGVRWPLEDAAIDAGGAPSISNEATEDQITVNATGGSVVVFRDLST